MISMIVKQFELETAVTQNIILGGEMPLGFSVAELDGKLMLWVQLEENYPGEFNLDVDVVATDIPCETQGTFVGTAIMSSGDIWHVFAKKNYIKTEDL